MHHNVIPRAALHSYRAFLIPANANSIELEELTCPLLALPT